MDEYFETLRFDPAGEWETEQFEAGGKRKAKPCRPLVSITDRLAKGMKGGPALDADIAKVLTEPWTAAKPAYNYIGPLDRMNTLLHATTAKGYYCALYIIQFPAGSPVKGYSGESGDLRQRMMQHRRCGNAFGLPLANYPVFAWFCPHLTEAQRRASEKELHTRLRPLGYLSNVINEVPDSLLEWESGQW